MRTVDHYLTLSEPLFVLFLGFVVESILVDVGHRRVYSVRSLLQLRFLTSFTIYPGFKERCTDTSALLGV
jgi:hypothetical protein